MPDDRNLGNPERAIPPRSDALRAELRAGNRELLHCLNCGIQYAAITHGGSCLYCGSEAVVIEAWG